MMAACSIFAERQNTGGIQEYLTAKAPFISAMLASLDADTNRMFRRRLGSSLIGSP